MLCHILLRAVASLKFPCSPPLLPYSQDSSATVDSDVRESSESEAVMSDSAENNDLFQHFEDA